MSLQDRFNTFHAENPHVLDTLLSLAQEAHTHGFKRIGIGMLYERARWELSLQTQGDVYRLNNDYRAFYARLIVDADPSLAGLFAMRRSAADRQPSAADPIINAQGQTQLIA